MEVVNRLASSFQVEGGKWLCHLARGQVDQVWARVAQALLEGALGQQVHRGRCAVSRCTLVVCRV